MKRLFALVLMLLNVLPAFAAKPLYTYARLGSSDDIVSQTSPGTVLMGGGTDVDAAFQWLCQRSGYGDILVIRVTGTDAYNQYIRDLCPNGNSVATLIIPSREAADSPAVSEIVSKAEAIWIAGGDQSDYVNYWMDRTNGTGTELQKTLYALLMKGIPVGGTSAGLDVLTQFIYSALENKGVTSAQALSNPYNRLITLDRDFVNLPLLSGVIGDTHTVTRDRMGRDVAFLCRIYQNGWSLAPRGIAVDEQTALLVDETTGLASVVGNSTAYFLQAPGAPEVCEPKAPLTYQNIAVYRLRAGGVFNMVEWVGYSGTAYSISVMGGVLSSTQPGGSPY